MLSSITQRYSSDVEGPSHVTLERGTPSLEKTEDRVVKTWPGGDDGGDTIGKSLRKPTRYGSGKWDSASREWGSLLEGGHSVLKHREPSGSDNC